MKIGDIYSIDEFIDEIINNGFYYLLLDVRNDFGNAVAVETCSQIYIPMNCEKLVYVYISGPKPAIPHDTGDTGDSDTFKIREKFSEEEKRKNVEKLIALIKNYKGPSDIRRKLLRTIYIIVNKFKEKFIINTNDFLISREHF